jgi:pimeloyl-ACP methyl ester carboxylesterase
MPMKVLAPLLALALLASACGGDNGDGTAATTSTTSTTEAPAATTTTTLPAAPDTTDGPVATTTSTVPPPPAALSSWSDCGSVQCATLTVPLDYTRPDGSTIDIPVSRRPASGDRIGVLLANPGGPGAPGTDYATGSLVSGDLLSRFDFITWDPRGTGGSTALTCVAPFEGLWTIDSGPDDPAEQGELDRAAEAVADECRVRHGDVLSHVDTESTVADMDALRRALGEDSISYIGFSYGTYLGLRYAERYGPNVRAMVLDGVVDPDQDLEDFLSGQLKGFLSVYDDMAADCGGRCPADDMDATLRRVLASAEAQPIPTRFGPDLGPSDIVTGTFYSAYGYSSQAWNDYYEALAAADDGDGSALLSLSDRYHQLVNFPAYVATTCVDSPGPTSPEEFAAMADRLADIDDRFGAGIANELAPCGTWPVEATGPLADVTASEAPPILVIGNTGDQATPYENSVEIAQELDQAALLTLEGTGHLSYSRSACVQNAADSYLIALDLPADGAVC